VLFRLKLALAFAGAAILAVLGELSGLVGNPHGIVGALIGACLALSLAFLGAGLLRRP
jgi:hypothetical protein